VSRPAGLALLALTLLASRASLAGAQEEAPLRFQVHPQTGEAAVEVGNLLDDSTLLETVRSGLPLRIRLLIQLWKDGFFDDQKGQYEWRASIVYDPLIRRFRVQAGGDAGASAEVNGWPEAQAFLQGTLQVPLRPPEPGRYYYLAVVEMETLSLSDLEELQRWLQGELGPVVAGEEDVEGALGRGFRRIFVRMLGLPTRRFQVRSPKFEIGESGGVTPTSPTDGG
jgi:hypothetical protein